MKLKKFFAGVLAAAMMLTVGATAAFADEPAEPTKSFADTTITRTTPLTLTKNYKVEKGVAPAEKFEFDIAYVGAYRKGTNVTAPSGSIDAKYADFKNAMSASANAYTENFSWTLNELNVPEGIGTFVYKITEKTGSTPATVYDVDKNTLGDLYMVVSVTHKLKDETSKEIVPNEYEYSVALRRYNGAVSASNVEVVSTGKKVSNTNAFTNTYGAGNSVNNVTLSKTVHGSFGDLSKTFDFIVKFEKPASAANVTYGAIVATKSDRSIIIKQGETVISAEGNADAVNLEYGKEYTVTMKHNQNVKFSNLPANVTYTMTEDGCVAGKLGDYTVTGEKTDGTMGSENAAVEIVNTHEGTPDMGVVLDNAPYIAMLAIVAIGGVALMLNKRRRDEE